MLLFLVVLVSLVGVLTGILTTPYRGIATAAFIFMNVGLCFRHKRKIHMPLMKTVMALDLLIVLILEFQRSAVKTAASLTMDIWGQIHVVSSLIALFLYIPMAVLGWRLSQNKRNNTHKILGIWTYLFRFLGFVMMWKMELG